MQDTTWKPHHGPAKVFSVSTGLIFALQKLSIEQNITTDMSAAVDDVSQIQTPFWTRIENAESISSSIFKVCHQGYDLTCISLLSNEYFSLHTGLKNDKKRKITHFQPPFLTKIRTVEKSGHDILKALIQSFHLVYESLLLKNCFRCYAWMNLSKVAKLPVFRRHLQ